MSETIIDLSKYENHLGRKHQLIRILWVVTWTLCAKWLPRSVGKNWKNFLARLFGARIAKTAHIYSTAKIYYPPFLIMGEYACLASDVECYNVAPVTIGANTTISQGTMLCTASHDISDPKNTLITAPIVIGEQAWVGARAFIGMGVTVGEGAVVGATASVFKDVEPWTVVGGNPARKIKNRIINER